VSIAAFARWLRHSGAGRAAAARLGALYIRLVNRTTRWRIEGRQHYDGLLAEGTGVIVVMWHGRLFMSPYWGDRRRHTVAMISNNQDGELIAAIVGRFGIHAVRGSTYDRAKARDKGGLRAYVGARRELKREHAIIGMSPDGPRGPRMRAQPGAAQLAIETRCPVQPVAFSTRWGRVLASWDRFFLPFPFGPGVQIWGEPLHPPSSGDPGGDAAATERFRERIEAALTEVTDRADALCGRAPVPPGPPLAPPGSPVASVAAPPTTPA
jgi:lysophospholipid acyltransferase (LPLAT)-like uncharacterized protein